MDSFLHASSYLAIYSFVYVPEVFLDRCALADIAGLKYILFKITCYIGGQSLLHCLFLMHFCTR
jgi:hypothetical protein